MLYLKSKNPCKDLQYKGLYFMCADRTVKRFAGLTLYVVHQRFYETFLQLPDDKHLDQALDNKGKYVVCDPMIITQHDGYSDNHKKIMEYDYYQRHYSFLKDPDQETGIIDKR